LVNIKTGGNQKNEDVGWREASLSLVEAWNPETFQPLPYPNSRPDHE
jgi:hypothetical protein